MVVWHVGCLLIGILVNRTLLMSNLVFESIDSQGGAKGVSRGGQGDKI